MWTSLVKEFEASVSSSSVESAKEFEQWFLGNAEVRLTQKWLLCSFKEMRLSLQTAKKDTSTGEICLQQTRMSFKSFPLLGKGHTEMEH